MLILMASRSKIKTKMNDKFSVLLPVYIKDDYRHFSRAIESIVVQQTYLPNQIVIVKDGPITRECNEVIHAIKTNHNCRLTVVENETNLGLGLALQKGLDYCSNEIIIRMDADDVSVPNRCEKQIQLLMAEKYSVVSSTIAEFSFDDAIVSGYRRLPVFHNDIVRYSKWRNPINHPAVAFLKKDIVAAGGYQDMKMFEDYYLWLRMIKAGMIFSNIDEVLVKMRAGVQQNLRRSGLNYAKRECRFFMHCARIGLLEKRYAAINCLTKFPVRILPKPLLSFFYSRIMRTHREK